MIEIGGQPILWHIMKHYAQYGHREFFVALGYKGEVIKHYFLDYYHSHGSMKLNLGTGAVERYHKARENWVIHLMDTGLQTYTGGRVKRLEPWLKDETFMVTYGDAVTNVDLDELIACHRANGRTATVTAVRPPARFGGLVFDGALVAEFTEKPQIGEGWINGGYMVFEPTLFDYLSGDESSLETNGLERLANERQLAAYRHEGFWQCMDTLRDKRLLENLWHQGNAPWKIWA